MTPIRFACRLCTVLLPAVLLAAAAQARLEIEIVQGVESALPIAVVPFAWQVDEPEPVERVGDIIAADLYRSGQFAPLAEQDMIERPSQPADIRFGTWRLLKTDALVIGTVRPGAGGGHEIDFHVFDVFSGRPLVQQTMVDRGGDLRFTAHRIADAIYEALTGVPGAFATRIAYVVASGTGEKINYELVVADSDGYNEQTIVASPEPLLSPAWSPDGVQIAYVSFARGNSTVVIQNIYTGERRTIAAHRGINGAPAFSPDGRRLALTLSRAGSPEINLYDLASGELTELTHHWAIDTEPVFTPDGRDILFTSDRGGRPQVYRIPAGGGDAERLTFQGEYNARPALSPDGRWLATTHGNGNDYRIALFHREDGQFRVLSSGRLDESPSFAPNGRMILYATKEAGNGVLAAVSIDGRVRQKLVQRLGDVREPAWSPRVR